jgi:hypothetical protein
MLMDLLGGRGGEFGSHVDEPHMLLQNEGADPNGGVFSKKRKQSKRH